MALLEVLTPNEQKLFDSPPQFLSTADRKNYFTLDQDLMNIINGLRGKTNKIGFVLQLGYFKWAGRFFPLKSFHKKDLNFVINQLKFSIDDVNIESYDPSAYRRHQEVILKYLGYTKFDQDVFKQEIARLVQKYIRPKQILIAIKEEFGRLKIELPSYYFFAEAISTEYNKTENILLETLKKQLTKKQLKEINDLLPIHYENNVEKPIYKRSILIGLRNIKQSLKPKDIKFNLQNFIKIKALYNEFKPTIDQLNLSKEATNYYAIWVSKARATQVAQFASIYKRALYVISFIAFQHSYTQDILVDILLRSTQTTINNIKQLQKDCDFEKREARNNSIKLLSECNNKSRGVLAEIKKIINTPIFTDRTKVEKIKFLIEENQQEFDRLYAGQFNQLEQDIDLAIKGQDYFEFMEKLSVKLQLRVSDLIKQLDFNANNSDPKIMTAINYYKQVDGKVDNKASTLFLDQTAINYLYDSKGNIKISLYKSLLFINIAEAIKSGKLNLAHSFRYLSIDEYLIDPKRWAKEKMLLLKRAGMQDLLDFKKLINKHKNAIEHKFEITNKNILNNKNQYLKFKEDGNFVVKTPAIDKLDFAKTAALFEETQYTPVISVLEAINKAAEFVDCFKHYSIKHNKAKPAANIFFAGTAYSDQNGHQIRSK